MKMLFNKDKREVIGATGKVFKVLRIKCYKRNRSGNARGVMFWFKDPCEGFLWIGNQVGDNSLAFCQKTNKKELPEPTNCLNLSFPPKL